MVVVKEVTESSPDKQVECVLIFQMVMVQRIWLVQKMALFIVVLCPTVSGVWLWLVVVVSSFILTFALLFS